MLIQILQNDGRQLKQSDAYLSAYRMWRETWSEEYTSFNPGFRLHSDNFTRQDQILAIFNDDDCVALTLFHEVDLATEVGRADSYFDPWPQSVLDQICGIEPVVLVCSALTVSKKYRGQKLHGVAVKDILAAASLHHFKKTDYPLMVGNMRNARGANKLVYKYGATLLKTVDCHAEPSDLVLFEKDKILGFPPEVETALNTSWFHPPIETFYKTA